MFRQLLALLRMFQLFVDDPDDPGGNATQDDDPDAGAEDGATDADDPDATGDDADVDAQDDEASDEGDDDKSDGDESKEGDPAANAGATDEELELLLDGKPLPALEPAAPWIKDLRKKVRDQGREIATLRANSGTTTQSPSSAAPADPGAKPTMAQFDFDADEYDKALSKWYERKNAAEAAKAERIRAQAAEEAAWRTRLDKFEGEVKSLKFSDAEDSVAAAQSEFNPIQQSLIIQYAERPALVMLALGRNPARARELARVEDPIQFAIAIKDQERKMSTTTRKKPTTKPESRIAGSGGGKSAVAGKDAARDKLIAEAQKSGNMAKLQAYDRAQRARNAANGAARR